MDSATILGARGLGLWDVVLLLLVAGLCGSLGQAISGVGSGGCLDGTKFPIVWSIMGSAVFVAVINLIARSRR